MILNPLLNEVFVFRPFEKVDLRYAEGKWIPDDGEPDLAFIGPSYGPPYAFYINLPDHTNILWSWMSSEESKKWVEKELDRYVSPWHYYTIDNEPWDDYHWDKRNKHPNEIAGRAAMDKCCNIHHCANGRGITIDSENDNIRQGKLWIRRTMERVIVPKNPICFLCLYDGQGHILNALRYKRSQFESDLELAQKCYDKALSDELDYEGNIEFYTKELAELNQIIKEKEIEK